MKISTKGRYGLTIMMELARHFGEGPVSLKSIATSKNLSTHYLEQIATPLRNAELIKSIRGAYGGYVLTNDPKEIYVGEVIRVLEGKITHVEGIENDEPALQTLWIQIRDAVKNVLDETTLQQLIDDDSEERNEYMFYI